MKYWTGISVACLLALQSACHGQWPPGIVARWNDGRASLNEIEVYLGESLDLEQSGKDLLLKYREAARELCVRDHIVRMRTSEVDSYDSPNDRELLRRRIAVSAFVRSRVNPSIKIKPDDIESFYSANPELFHRPERRFVEHIFRRLDNDWDQAATYELLEDLRSRHLAGDAFHTLAVEYSQSETATYGGALGAVSKGDLAEAAEEAVFSLEIGQISEPTPVHGGLAVFIVTQIYPEKTFPLQDVRNQITNELKQERQRQRLDAIAADYPLPNGVRTTPESSFHEALESSDPTSVLYSDDVLVLTVEDWRKRLTGSTADAQHAQYVEFLRVQQVFHFLRLDGFLDEPGHRAAIESMYENTLESHVAILATRSLLKKKATEKPEALEEWYEENRLRFQSPLELLVNALTVAPSVDVEDTAAMLRSAASQYKGGSLEQTASSIDRASSASGWVGVSSFDAYHPRVKATLLDLDPPACGPVFNIGGNLSLFCLEERREPRQLSFDEARDRIIEDYISANEQRLYEDIQSKILVNSGFEFNEDRVRDALHVSQPSSP